MGAPKVELKKDFTDGQILYGIELNQISEPIELAINTHADMIDNIEVYQTDFYNHMADVLNPHEVTKAQVGLLHVTNDAQVKRSEMGVASGVATLDVTGKILPEQIPAVAITKVTVVASELEMLALVSEVGDLAVRTDLNKSFILRESPASTLSNWVEILTPTDAVTTVNGQTGTVVLNADDIDFLDGENFQEKYDQGDLQGEQGEPGLDINWMGEYSELTNYVINDAVSYLGSSYICKLISTGNLPTNTLYFDLMAQKGDTGDVINITDISDVEIVSPIDGQMLRFEDGIWENDTIRHSNGCHEHPSIADNGDGSVTLGDGTYYITSDVAGANPILKFNIPGQVLTLTDGSSNYIIADYNAGSPIVRVTTNVDIITETQIIPIYSIFRMGTSLHTQNWDSLGNSLSNKIHQSIVKTQKYRRESGLAISETGVRNLILTQGRVWTGAVPINLDAINTSIDNLRFYHHVAGVWTMSLLTQYPNTQYDNGTNLVTLGVNRYAVNWIFRGIESQKHLYIVAGTGNYTLTEAQNAMIPQLPVAISSHSVLVAKLIVQNGQNTANSIQGAFDTAFALGGVSDHASLTNLQGGAVGEYYHLTSAEMGVVDNTSGVNTGDQDLSGLIPYTGATTDIDLNSNGIENVSFINMSGFTPSLPNDVTTKSYVDGLIPVKATGAEINTGTDDAKCVTSKAIEDSNIIRSVGDSVKNVVALTKAEFDAIVTKDTNTIYNVTDELDNSIIVENVLTSTSAVNALSANMGKTLNDTKAPIANPVFTGVVTSPVFKTTSGSISCATSVANQALALQAPGMYLCSVYYSANEANNPYFGFAIISTDGTARSKIHLSNFGASVSITMVNLNMTITQTSGITLLMNYSVTRIV